MDLKQSKIILEKINALHKTISLDNGEIATIERDLMLSYIRQFYESFHEGTTSTGKTKKVKSKSESKKAQKANLEVVESVKAPKKIYTPPKIIEIPDSIKEIAETSPPPPPPPKPSPKPEPVPKKKAVVASSDDIEALFQHKEAKELSEKLSERPVKDLAKAMAINDRLLFMNSLFGKDNNALNQALSELNGFSSMEDAKGALVRLAEQYNWTENERKDTAKGFIKLVRRRYN